MIWKTGFVLSNPTERHIQKQHQATDSGNTQDRWFLMPTVFLRQRTFKHMISFQQYHLPHMHFRDVTCPFSALQATKVACSGFKFASFSARTNAGSHVGLCSSGHSHIYTDRKEKRHSSWEAPARTIQISTMQTLTDTATSEYYWHSTREVRQCSQDMVGRDFRHI